MPEEFRPFGRDPNDEYFWEQLASDLVLAGAIPEYNLTLAREWYEREKLADAPERRGQLD